MTETVDATVNYGVQVRKICAACHEFTPSQACYDDFCGAGVYGSDATMSGLLMVPVEYGKGKDKNNLVTLKGTLKVSMRDVRVFVCRATNLWCY